ncbi:unnamed protein product [Parnassius apollo]|uniref:(apollo) hypothetical protein n=1 Tax=Parnassius apollo TaxID=110799 RepID=A0A8S3X3S1_PARAO|nr:unnamed protein product [Parnassius apollo]
MLVPVSEIKRKKETLLAAFRLNHKKVVASLKSGAGEDEVFKPIWVFYDALAAFMIDVYECKSVLVTADKDNIEEEGADEIPDMQQYTQGQESSTTVSIPVQKRRSTKLPELAETNAEIKSTLFTLNDVLTVERNRDGKVEEDDCDLYGRLLAKALREFSAIDRV